MQSRQRDVNCVAYLSKFGFFDFSNSTNDFTSVLSMHLARPSNTSSMIFSIFFAMHASHYDTYL
jgi:hypothetical protein